MQIIPKIHEIETDGLYLIPKEQTELVQALDGRFDNVFKIEEVKRHLEMYIWPLAHVLEGIVQFLGERLHRRVYGIESENDPEKPRCEIPATVHDKNK